MAYNFLRTKLSLLPHIFQPTRDAIFSFLPFRYRWRLLALQPLNLLSLLITSPSWLFDNRSSVLYVPTRSGPKRCLVYQPPSTGQEQERQGRKPRPLHIDIHGGAWIGGFPEHTARWCASLAVRTGAVVISISYRFAPLHTYPAAHDDVDDVVRYLLNHAAAVGADASLLTLSGSSAGGNLALGVAQMLHSQAASMSAAGERGEVARGYVGFYPVLDLRLRPEEKHKPPKFPNTDPLAWMTPLYDSYAEPTRKRDGDDARINVVVSEKETLPANMFFVVAGIDILACEQLAFVERVRGELDKEGGSEERCVEARVWEEGFHGWLELPKWILEKERMEAYGSAVEFIQRVHRKHSFTFST
ncbi:hypothetical protein DPSP01_000393 [Paraphaeosphaeria sporulosa]